MTVGGLIAAILAFYAAVELLAWAGRQPEGWVNPKASPLAGHPWRSRWIGFLATLAIIASVAVLSGIAIGLVFVCQHLNARVF
jgi:hypothetical protein